MINIRKFIVNPLRENSYLLFDETRDCIIIDAGFYYEEEYDEISDFIKTNKLNPVALINTHCHFDHLMGIEFCRNTFHLKFGCHQADSFLIERSAQQASIFGFSMPTINPPDYFIGENELIRFGNSELLTIHVPGHSPGHLVFYSQADNFIIAGDVLFYGSIGRTDLPGGNHSELISQITAKLLVLPHETKVYSGHGPETSIGFEKLHNPFLR